MIIWAIVLATVYRTLRRIKINNVDIHTLLRRQDAIRTAKIYLAPHKSIWKNLKLVNRHCKLELGEEASIISGYEKVAPYRKFSVLSSEVHGYEDLWNMFCKDFSFGTSYEGLKERCYRFRVTIREYIDDTSVTQSEQSVIKKIKVNDDLKEINTNNKIEFNKVDINNCSEIELTELPGINIIMAKKIIKKREDIKGFKNINQFFEFLNIKPHFKEQLVNKIVVTKMQGTVEIARTKERNIDL